MLHLNLQDLALTHKRLKRVAAERDDAYRTEWILSDQTAPHDAPDRPAVGKVSTTISHQQAVVNGRDGAGIDICTLNQVVDKEDNQY